MKRRVTNEEILEAMNVFATNVENRFESIESRMATKEELAKVKLDLIDIIDRKIAEVRGDLTALMRKHSLKPIQS